ncbi:hypothetical protein O9G_006085 [Rozella allomycis CSF55]|uniref:Uncharacterized protein n=1 Tax=Rozella allomycis (strain CSF55) TaxID=988480 RepID=A0A075B0T1_ROZAC|nr:hypothetical protein O9G_006085 [Rozella allomycis CSF55]|eukprot:EPZ36159.1 hypothetical protein O9G_006085 [Rozella allomycis CSF55]
MNVCARSTLQCLKQDVLQTQYVKRKPSVLKYLKWTDGKQGEATKLDEISKLDTSEKKKESH